MIHTSFNAVPAECSLTKDKLIDMFRITLKGFEDSINQQFIAAYNNKDNNCQQK